MNKALPISNVRYAALAAAVASILLGTAAQAQPEPQDQRVEEVTVTGSRIVRRDFAANSPIMTVDTDRFKESSTIAMESVLNQLPQFVPAMSQFQEVPGTALGNAGGPTVTPTAATVSLRGLGANRNLVLLDGRRAMPVDASMAVDINSIPSAAIARVETITGGASSVYGADAVTGVVNFIIRDDFEGFDFDTHYGLTERGDGEEKSVSIVFGSNVGDNGNVLLGVERYDRGRVWQADREFFTNGWADTASQGGLQVFYTAPYISNSAENPFSQPALDAIFGGTVNAATGTGGYYLNADGTVYRTGLDGNYRYNGPTKTADGLAYRFVRDDNGVLSENSVGYQESSPMTRHSFFGRGKFGVSKNITAFAQAMFADTRGEWPQRVGGFVGGWGGTVPHGSDIYAPSLDSNGNTLVDYLPGGRFGLNCEADGVPGCTMSEAWPTSPEVAALLDSRPDPDAPVDVGIATTWWGNRTAIVNTRSYQFLAGLDGVFPEKDWTWELYASYGTTATENEAVGNGSLQRWRFVINQPNYGAGLFYRGNEEGDNFGAGVLECTSGFSTLGQGERYYLPSTGLSNAAPSADCLDAIGATLVMNGTLDQTVMEFNMQGGIVELPAGELSFALGASHRENGFRWIPPTLLTPASVFDLGAGQFPRSETRGEISTSELYGEMFVPLIANKPGAESLNLELGYRYSDNDPTDSVESYKALLDWRILPKVRIRGGHQVANRAPNVAELFQSANQREFVGFHGDWCSDLNPVNELSPNPALNPNAAEVRNICETLMTPTGASNFYNNPDRNAAAVHYIFGFVEGNPNLSEETAGTTTLGIVTDITDRLTLTIDYWNIKIDDMITSQDPNAIYQQCFSPDTNPSFDPNYEACRQLVRDPLNGNDANTLLKFTNEGAIDFAGYDVTLDWTGAVGPGDLHVNAVATLSDKVKTRVSPESPWTEWKGTSGPSDLTGLDSYAYDYRTFVTTNYDLGRWATTLRWRHLPSIKSEGTLAAGSTFEPTGSYDIFDFAGRYMVADHVDLRFGVDNLFDRDPERTFPEATNTAMGQTNASFYDILGRRYYVGLSLQF
jgi:outer membrane receptor protein involved in Fe transport